MNHAAALEQLAPFVVSVSDRCAGVVLSDRVVYAGHCGTSHETARPLTGPPLALSRCTSHDDSELGSGTDIAECLLSGAAASPRALCEGSAQLRDGLPVFFVSQQAARAERLLVGTVVSIRREIEVEFAQLPKKGDSGGGLFVPQADEWCLVGILSSSGTSAEGVSSARFVPIAKRKELVFREGTQSNTAAPRLAAPAPKPREERTNVGVWVLSPVLALGSLFILARARHRLKRLWRNALRSGGGLALWLVGSTALASTGCNTNCTPSTEPPQVFVIDARRNEPICDAKVEVSQSASQVHPSSDCSGLFALDQRAGRYAVTVSAPGYVTKTENVTVTQDSCERTQVTPAGPRDGHPGFGMTVTVPLEPVD